MTVSAGIKIVGALAAMLLLSAGSCNRAATVGIEPATRYYCQAYKPVRWSKLDTDYSIEQNKENNAVWVDACR